MEVHVLDGSVYSGILHATNADKDFGMLGKAYPMVIFLSVGILVVNFICNTMLIIISFFLVLNCCRYCSQNGSLGKRWFSWAEVYF